MFFGSLLPYFFFILLLALNFQKIAQGFNQEYVDPGYHNIILFILTRLSGIMATPEENHLLFWSTGKRALVAVHLVIIERYQRPQWAGLR